jgi:hypothetical protein
MAQCRCIFEEGHSYFITVVTHGRMGILTQNIDLLRQSFITQKVNPQAETTKVTSQFSKSGIMNIQ